MKYLSIFPSISQSSNPSVSLLFKLLNNALNLSDLALKSTKHKLEVGNKMSDEIFITVFQNGYM